MSDKKYPRALDEIDEALSKIQFDNVGAAKVAIQLSNLIDAIRKICESLI